MAAIAPNLTLMVGELVGARLIAHSGSLINLAKHPASTIQILGAEKALFRALKTKSDTPKYGLIYHASLIGQAAPKIKGKISRVLAAKTALAIRVDALGDAEGPSIGYDSRVKVEARIRQLEGGQRAISNVSNTLQQYDAHASRAAAAPAYNESTDVALVSNEALGSKRSRSGEDDEEKESKKSKKEDSDSKDKKKKKKKSESS
jgi:nucleolar protein 58